MVNNFIRHLKYKIEFCQSKLFSFLFAIMCASPFDEDLVFLFVDGVDDAVFEVEAVRVVVC